VKPAWSSRWWQTKFANLAQRSAQAARDTTALIEESIAASNEGELKVDEVATAIRSITGESAQVKIRVDELSMGSEEQSRGIEQIVKAIAEMERVTQTSAASAEESASAAQELSAQAETLMRVADSLTAMVSGAQASAGHPALQSRAAGGKPVATAAKAAFPLEDRYPEF
jgi:methyl-accepting chemotaxis protein/methyl-accepting chemotaxis protein-1 (serine sensor receptor)